MHAVTARDLHDDNSSTGGSHKGGAQELAPPGARERHPSTGGSELQGQDYMVHLCAGQGQVSPCLRGVPGRENTTLFKLVLVNTYSAASVVRSRVPVGLDSGCLPLDLLLNSISLRIARVVCLSSQAWTPPPSEYRQRASSFHLMFLTEV